jgi:hypothetical protein
VAPVQNPPAPRFVLRVPTAIVEPTQPSQPSVPITPIEQPIITTEPLSIPVVQPQQQPASLPATVPITSSPPAHPIIARGLHV